MNSRRNLSTLQRRFLKDLPTYKGPIETFLKRKKVSIPCFARWLANPNFKVFLQSTLRMMDQICEFNLQTAAQNAAVKLICTRKGFGTKGAFQNFKALIEMIDVARARPAARKPKPVKPSNKQRHLGPDLSDERSQQLFRQLVDGHLEATAKSAKR